MFRKKNTNNIKYGHLLKKEIKEPRRVNRSELVNYIDVYSYCTLLYTYVRTDFCLRVTNIITYLYYYIIVTFRTHGHIVVQ